MSRLPGSQSSHPHAGPYFTDLFLHHNPMLAKTGKATDDGDSEWYIALERIFAQEAFRNLFSLGEQVCRRTPACWVDGLFL